MLVWLSGMHMLQKMGIEWLNDRQSAKGSGIYLGIISMPMQLESSAAVIEDLAHF